MSEKWYMSEPPLGKEDKFLQARRDRILQLEADLEECNECCLEETFRANDAEARLDAVAEVKQYVRLIDVKKEAKMMFAKDVFAALKEPKE